MGWRWSGGPRCLLTLLTEELLLPVGCLEYSCQEDGSTESHITPLIPLGVQPELLDHGHPIFKFWGITVSFSKSAMPFCTPTYAPQVCQFFYVLHRMCYFSIFYSRYFKAYEVVCHSYFLAVLGFELSSLHLLSRYFTTWAAPAGFFALVIFWLGSWVFAQANLGAWISYLCFPCSWDYKGEQRCLVFIEMGSQTLYAWIGLEVQSSLFLPSK
jgi:hypothetical protein